MDGHRSTLALTVAALCGFAANSLLCRTALGRASGIDPVSFTTVRVVSGAAVLILLATVQGGKRPTSGGSWGSAVALFVYAIAFSLAYVRLTTGTGALLLFGVVQLTMLAGGLLAGERPRPQQWLGFSVAMIGLVVLSWPGLAAPEPVYGVLMSMAGVAWGIYSLRGRGSRHPLADTAGNFARSVPLAVGVSVIMFGSARASWSGLLLAAASGALASGLGYSLWYAALPRLTATRASIVQLAVPVLAAAGGVVVLGERVTLRLVVAALAILSGVAIAVGRR